MRRMYFYCETITVLLVKFLASAGVYILKSELEESAAIMPHIHILPRHRRFVKPCTPCSLTPSLA